jgi:hypothetical protein
MSYPVPRSATGSIRAGDLILANDRPAAFADVEAEEFCGLDDALIRRHQTTVSGDVECIRIARGPAKGASRAADCTLIRTSHRRAGAG